MRKGKSIAIDMTRERMIILVKLRIALCGHASMPHHDIYTVRNMDFHLPSGQGTFVDAQTVVKVVRNAGRIRSAYLTLSCESVKILFFVCVLRHSLKSIKPNKLHILFLLRASSNGFIDI